jgi:hypothetical protein
MSTSPGPASGSGTSVSSSPGPWAALTRAFKSFPPQSAARVIRNDEWISRLPIRT